MIRIVRKLFGIRKSLLFVSRIPIAIIKGENRVAYEAMGECHARLFAEKDILFKHPDPRFIDEIVLQRLYCPADFFKIGPESVIVDAGANVGIFTIFAACLATEGKVFSIEPEKTNFKFLKENVEANGLTNVILINAALSNRIGEAELFIGNTGGNTILHALSSRKRSQKCITLSMEELFRKYAIVHVDFLKMDIEGAEFLIFETAPWLKNVERISMEVHPKAGLIDNIKNSLISFGFNVEIKPAYDDGHFYLYTTRIK